MFIPSLHRGYFKQRNGVQYAQMHTALETDEKNDMVKITFSSNAGFSHYSKQINDTKELPKN